MTSTKKPPKRKVMIPGGRDEKSIQLIVDERRFLEENCWCWACHPEKGWLHLGYRRLGHGYACTDERRAHGRPTPALIALVAGDLSDEGLRRQATRTNAEARTIR